MSDAQSVFNYIPAAAKEKERAFYELAVGYAKNRLGQTRVRLLTRCGQTLPKSDLIAKNID